MSTQPFTRSSEQPLGTGGALGRRLLLHHVPLALTSVLLVVLWMTLPLFQSAGHQGPPPGVRHTDAGHHQPPAGSAGHQRTPQPTAHSSMQNDPEQAGHREGLEHRRFLARITTATGYVALGLLGFTLLLGPANLLLRRRNPVSNYLRRDVGAWTAIVSVVHVIVGLQVHGPPVSFGERILHYFVEPDGSLLTNSFGLGNWTGLAATVIAVVLLAISSDWALRKLKAGPWKWLQRLNYALFALVIAHAVFYGALSRVASPSTVLLAVSVFVVVAGQLLGIRMWRRRHSRVV